jgi:hypothetical protein
MTNLQRCVRRHLCFSDVPGLGPIDAPANQGLQLFQVNGSPLGQAVPEPSGLTLAALGRAVVLGATWPRRRAGSAAARG